MKRIFKMGMLLTAALVLFAGCGSKNNENNAEQGDNNTVVEQVTPTPTPTPEPVLEDADITWQEFVKNMGMGWNLGNTFDTIDMNVGELAYETAWLSGNGRAKTSQEMITAIKNQGFQTVRIPVSWHNHVDVIKNEDGTKNYTIRKEWLDRVQEVVDYCVNEDLYIILNIHHDDRNGSWIYPTERSKDNSLRYITDIWTQLAERFAEYDMHLIFETMNEVRLAGKEEEWDPNAAASKDAQNIINEFNQAAVDAIRAVGDGYNQARFIICPGYAASMYAYPNYVIPTDNGGYEKRIIMDVHAYAPYNFCMDRSENGKSVYDSHVQSAIKDVFYTIEEKFISKDIPVVITEWGAIMRPDNKDARVKYAKTYVTRATTSCQDSEGNTVPVPCILWDNGYFGDLDQNETYGSFDRKNLNWVDQEYVDAIIDAAKGEE